MWEISTLSFQCYLITFLAFGLVEVSALLRIDCKSCVCCCCFIFVVYILRQGFLCVALEVLELAL